MFTLKKNGLITYQKNSVEFTHINIVHLSNSPSHFATLNGILLLRDRSTMQRRRVYGPDDHGGDDSPRGPVRGRGRTPSPPRQYTPESPHCNGQQCGLCTACKQGYWIDRGNWATSEEEGTSDSDATGDDFEQYRAWSPREWDHHVEPVSIGEPSSASYPSGAVFPDTAATQRVEPSRLERDSGLLPTYDLCDDRTNRGPRGN